MKQNSLFFLAVIIGNIFEMFDFFVFVFLSSIIADVFFPHNIGNLSLIFTYLTITVGYLLRPIGGIILGNFGDKYGRKSVFTLSILLTAIPSLVIGLIPSYDKIGYVATFLLIISRVLQGFAAGGEFPGSITFLAEKYNKKNYYFYCAWLPFGANIGVAGGALLIKIMTSSMSKTFLINYGWRIPFICGSLLAVIGFYIRKNLSESRQFVTLKENHKLYKLPIFNLLKGYLVPLILGIILCTVVSLITGIFHLFLPSLFVKYLHLSLQDVTGISFIGSFTLAIFIIIFASLTYWIKPMKIIQSAIICLIISFGLIFIDVLNMKDLYSLSLVVILISVLIAGVNGIYAGILVDLFPVQVRYSGIAVCFTIGAMLGGGLTPLWTSSILT
ncbi:MAG: MFS transporter, partial [Neisseriaceae bacterium]